MKTVNGRTAQQLWDALEKSELKRQQLEKMVALQKVHISQLESIVLQVRNCVTPRVMQKISAEQEPFVDHKGVQYSHTENIDD
ncbi:hypothetical protein [Pseudomonas phage PMBT14]|uniref:Uncharacterized protein n=1 Tax=Pseudomonas phage PMBT14 TaxID=2059855 RepID=A0A2I6PI88_9CAUD|nr:hypothetical protein HWB42_gp58 [Pseudomonas phage PMBT14]AUM59776.1 hypothetical protein [Pseudomonas phage PMBT14]